MLTSDRYELDTISIIATERCNAQCRTCSYWRNPTGQDFDPSRLPRLLQSLHEHGGRRVVWTGGEPTLHPQLNTMMAQVKNAGINNILITNGIRLHKELEIYAPLTDTLILSMDAPSRELYRTIRGVDAFELHISLLSQVRRHHPAIGRVICLVVQRMNIDVLEDFLILAATLEVDRVALLAPDLYGYHMPQLRGGSFGRGTGMGDAVVEDIIPTPSQIDALEDKLPTLRQRWREHPRLDCPTLDFLQIYCDYFRAYHDGSRLADNPRCLLPLHHTVVTAEGCLKPCFFIPESISPAKDGDPLRNPELDVLRQLLLHDSVIRERSCRICMQTVRNFP